MLSVTESLYCNNVQCTDPEHSMERESLIIDITSIMIETSHKCIPMTRPKHAVSNPAKSCPIQENIPGWREIIHPYKEDAAF